ncbi:uncharacterized protein LOC118187556 [Stegodyphus dumicola]|uniref:uncharacterized protein LOC118187556 n=1 Tax=Stegodyphus dumicola TaxID=202533 RepID=UPI0015ADB8FD|nr:uncharacterized protein LOC118187556 [Stegodyphus dumicola]XP_035213690.1 uncharacterized protein LOC118187556 [Stegodyphus dumicola]
MSRNSKTKETELTQCLSNNTISTNRKKRSDTESHMEVPKNAKKRRRESSSPVDIQRNVSRKRKDLIMPTSSKSKVSTTKSPSVRKRDLRRLGYCPNSGNIRVSNVKISDINTIRTRRNTYSLISLPEVNYGIKKRVVRRRGRKIRTIKNDEMSSEISQPESMQESEVENETQSQREIREERREERRVHPLSTWVSKAVKVMSSYIVAWI